MIHDNSGGTCRQNDTNQNKLRNTIFQDLYSFCLLKIQELPNKDTIIDHFKMMGSRRMCL